MKNILKVLLMTIPILSSAGEFDARYYFDEFSKYVVTPVNLMEMKHRLVVEILQDIDKANKEIILQKVGESCKGRSINIVSFGSGDTKLLLWSQMHGDEPTATAALLSIFKYFAKEFKTSFVQDLYKNLSIHAIVMLNPDGAERFQRRNAQAIDINRDAQRLVSPEAQILKKMKDEIDPDYGFNLHDMRGRETVGESGEILSLALMAPPFNKENTDSPTRSRAKKLAVIMKNTADKFIEGHVAKYKADYMPRAFGDAFQNWQVSTVLLEAGLTTTTEPHHLVRMNFVVLLAAFDAISRGSVEDVDSDLYDQIPLEGIEAYDILIKNVMIYNGRDISPFRGDVGINIDYKWKDNSSIATGTIEDIGDLSITSGIKEIEGENLIVTPGLIVRVDENVVEEVIFEKGVTTPISADFYPEEDKIKGFPRNNWLEFDHLSDYTRMAAKILNIQNKGVLDKEMAADLLIFDGRDQNKLNFENLKYVIKNGMIVYEARSRVEQDRPD